MLLQSLIYNASICQTISNNMDESAFAIRTIQSSRPMVNVRGRLSWRANLGRQEWITAIEGIIVLRIEHGAPQPRAHQGGSTAGHSSRTAKNQPQEARMRDGRGTRYIGTESASLDLVFNLSF